MPAVLLRSLACSGIADGAQLDGAQLRADLAQAVLPQLVRTLRGSARVQRCSHR